MGKKKTHEEFLEDLKVKNPKAYEELDFLEEYKGSGIKIKTKDKYGIILVQPDSLMTGRMPTIEIAEDKTRYFIEKCKDLVDKYYDYSEVIYIKSNIKIKLTCERGHVFYIKPNHLLNGNGCKECRSINLQERNIEDRAKTFYKKSIDKFGDKYDYSKVVYKGSKVPVTIYCKIHKEWFTQRPNDHLQSFGCSKCGLKRRNSNTDEFLEKAKGVHGDEYDYSLVDYKTTRIKVKIICKTHGVFEQSPHGHLKGRGCSDCGKIDFWSRSKWVKAGEKSNYFDGFKLYKIKMTDDDNYVFYKIGITFLDLGRRFVGSRMPYEYEIVEVIESDDGSYIYDLENELHQKYKEFSYKPKKSFKGDGECFSYIGID